MDSENITIYRETIGSRSSIFSPIIKAVQYLLNTAVAVVIGTIRWLKGVTTSAILLSILLFIVINFYIFSSIVNLNSFFYSFFVLSILTDGAYILIHLPRRRSRHYNVSFDPAKVTVVIACYNGQDVIGETIRQAATQVPLSQIIVVSDASSDRTDELVRQTGVRLIRNRQNLNKAFSINVAMRWVHTPYVLLLDDDTLIENSFIPTSLLDDGYSGVAFNVLPAKERGLINELQQFEYQQSMELGKHIKASTGAVGNVSGAIGLFRTKDMIRQVSRHSGQFAGEDEQRTLLVHLSNTGKGITYANSTVMTKAPSRYLDLYRQRAYGWSAALPEMTILYWRVLLSSRYHYLLKSEKAYQLYILLTDPLRMLFFWVIFVKSSHLLVIYGFYLILSSIVWAKLRFKSSLRAVIFFPLYTLFLTVCRFIGHFYWFAIKFKYLGKKLYRYAENRHLLMEYSLIFAIIISSWVISGIHLSKEVNLLNKIHSNQLHAVGNNFKYDDSTAYGTVQSVPVAAAPADAPYLQVPVDKGDTQRAIAYKSIIQYLEQNGDITALMTEHETAYTWLAAQIQPFNSNQPGLGIRVDKATIQQALDKEAPQGGVKQ